MSEPGRHIGPYELDVVIGTGSFAAVHRAIDERLGDTVALKVLADNHALSSEMRERFITEGRVLRRIDSPHVVRVLDIGETDHHQPYLVLEYADQGTLAQRVASLREQRWTPGPADLLVVARAVATGVAALHRAELVHRDLSPGNVLIRSTLAPQHHGELLGNAHVDRGGRRHDDREAHLGDGPAGPDGVGVLAPDERLMLADLGLCKDLAWHSGFTQAAGTEGFRPPEQRAGPARVDARADLWALSALLVWLAVGTPPGTQRAATLLGRTHLPFQLGRVLDVSLAEDPAARHTDVASWLADVEAALPPAPLTVGLGPPGHMDRRPAGLPRGGRLRRLAMPVATSLLAGVVIGASAATVISRGDGRRGELDRLEADGAEVVSESGAARLAVTGPSEVATGQDAELEAQVTGVEHWVWLLPDGEVAFDQETVTLRAHSSGVSRVTLLGVTSTSGERLVVHHDLQVVDD